MTVVRGVVTLLCLAIRVMKDTMPRLPILVILALSGLAFALSPLERDCVLYDGSVRTTDGVARLNVQVPAGRQLVGFFLGIEGIEQFTISLNGTILRTVMPGPTPRTIIRTLDLSDFASLLKPGVNQLDIFPADGGSEFRLRTWVSDRAWYVSSFHAHTTYSDGVLSVHDLLQAALADGGRAYAVTDHETLGQCYDTAFHDVGNMTVIRGYEWTTDSGHACLVGIQGANTLPHGSIHDMIDEATWRGAMIQVNHPTDPTMEWLRRPALDPGLDWLEVFNSLTYFPPCALRRESEAAPLLVGASGVAPDSGRRRSGGLDSDAQAVAWWQELLSGGATIAAAGCSDYHGIYPGEAPLKSCSFVWAPSNHPDTILKYTKLGTVMVFDTPDNSRLWLYADTNNNGSWDIVMGEHVRVSTGSKTVRFRLEVEDADWTDVVYVFDKSGEIYSKTLWTGGDFEYEWSRTFSSADRNFFRVELCAELGADYEGVTNPIYVNHRDYELGPTELLTAAVSWPDTLYVGRADTLHFLIRNTAGYSPYRTGLAVALDTGLFDVVHWQTSGPGVGRVVERSSQGHRIIEWQAGYEWQNRLPVGTNFQYWLLVRPKAAGSNPVLFRSWADDRLFIVDEDPGRGFLGPEAKYWYRRSVPVGQLVGTAEPVMARLVSDWSVSPNPAPDFIALQINYSPDDPLQSAVLYDLTGRALGELPIPRLAPGPNNIKWQLGNVAGTGLAEGIYFLRVSTHLRQRTERIVLAR
ncbi:MAG: CehA/McbA family metallohydrolase [candidate division WOR-3 bacterium]